MKTFRVALPAHDIRARAHASRNNAHIAFPRPHRALASYQHIGTVVRLTRHIIVVAVNRFRVRLKRAYLPRMSDSGDDLLHHQVSIRAGIILRPFHGMNVIIKMIRVFREIS